MGSRLVSPNSEAAIWARLMHAQKDELSPEAAEFLLAMDFEESDGQRMLQLAERSEGGTSTAAEQMEVDGHLHAGNLLTVMQSKARLALRTKVRERVTLNRDVVREVRRLAQVPNEPSCAPQQAAFGHFCHRLLTLSPFMSIASLQVRVEARVENGTDWRRSCGT